jgi:hypothetical protein
MIRTKMKTWAFLLLLLSTALAVRADSFSLAYNYHSTGNLFQTSEALSDTMSSFGLFLDNDSEGLSFLSDLRYVLFRENPGLSFGTVNLGLDYLKPSGTKSAFYFAAGGSGSFFRSEWSPFNSLSFDLVGAFKTYLAPSSILKLQSRSAYASFRYALFDHLSQSLSLSLDKFFPSLTTLKTEAVWKYKYFLHPFLRTLPETTPVMGGGGGPVYRGGHGFVPVYDPYGGGSGIQSASLALLAAQGLGSRVGLSVSGSRQWTLSGTNPFASIEEFYLVSNPSSDEFSWNGWTAAALLTVLLPWDIEVKAAYTYTDRAFPGIEVMTAEREPTGVPRDDTRRSFEARLEKIFPKLTVFIAYSRSDNRSNDPLFTWSSPYLLAGIEWTLPFGRKE